MKAVYREAHPLSGAASACLWCSDLSLYNMVIPLAAKAGLHLLLDAVKDPAHPLPHTQAVAQQVVRKCKHHAMNSARCAKALTDALKRAIAKVCPDFDLGAR